MSREDETKRDSSLSIHIGEATQPTPPGTDSSAEYFDRERWHDVEGEDVLRQEVAREKWLTYTTFSVAVLLLVALVTGMIAAWSFHRISLLEEPITPAMDFRSIPVQWIGYNQEYVAFCAELNDPVCFAAARDGTMYIGDAQPPSIHSYAKNAKPIRVFTLDEEPLTLAVGEPKTVFAGKILVAFSKHLACYTPEGEKTFQWELSDVNHDIRSLVLTEDSVFAADSRKKVVYRWDEQGKLLGQFGDDVKKVRKDAEKSGEFPGFVVFLSPMTLSVSPATGIVYVANPGRHRIEAFTQDGYWEPSLSWESPSSDITGFAGCCNPVQIACLDDGRLVTAEKSITRVKVLLPGGKLDWIVAGPELLDVKPRNIPQLEDMPIRTVADNNDRPIFMAVVDTGTVLVFDPVLRVVRCFLPNNASKGGNR